MGRVMVAGLGLLATVGCAAEPAFEDPGENVVLITLDGVRAQEVFGLPEAALSDGDDAPAFPLLHESLLSEGVIYGDPTAFEIMTTTNQAQVSLPGYQSIFAGFEQPCHDNNCARVGVETLLERVQRKLRLARGQVAVFGSWEIMARAVEHVEGALLVNVGPMPVVDGDDPVIASVNASQRADRPPWPMARWDVYTWSLAMNHLETHRPRLLHIHLLDGDAYGHEGDYPSYLATLRQYDRWIAELRGRLAGMGEYGRRTTIIVTTDHGRGDGELWTEHNSETPGSERVFLYAVGPHVAHGAERGTYELHDSADIRPTIEALFGLRPITCDTCGSVLDEVVANGSSPELGEGLY